MKTRMTAALIALGIMACESDEGADGLDVQMHDSAGGSSGI